MKSIEITRERKALVIFMTALLAAFLYMMRPFLMPIVLALIIVVLFFPLYKEILQRTGQRPRLSALITTFTIFFIIILPTAWIGAILINQIYSFIGDLDLKHNFSLLYTTNAYTLYVEPWIQNIENRFHLQIDLFAVLTNFGKEIGRSIYDYSPSVLLGTANFVFGFFIMLVGIYFLFLEGAKLLKVFFDISPLRETHERRLCNKVADTIHASVYGYLLTGLVQGIIGGVIFAIVGLKAFVVLGTLTFFMSMVPVIGAAGVWIPVCVWLFLQGETMHAMVVLIGGAAVISSIDNFLKPIIIQGKTHIHPLLIFFSLFGGIKLFGPLGILFGPVVTALLIATINIFRQESATSTTTL